MAILHIKRSGHESLMNDFNLKENQTIYLEDYGHIGQIDQILSLHLALQTGQVKEGSVGNDYRNLTLGIQQIRITLASE